MRTRPATRVCWPWGLALALLTSVPAPAHAQLDLSGSWVSREHEDYIERMPGPDAVEFQGIPINAEGRAMALSYTSTTLTMPERQCLYYTPHYVVTGPQGVKIWSDTDPVTGQIVAWKLSGAIDRAPLTIWMDGRPHPSRNALHTFAGFMTGEWQGATLKATMTHIKAGYLRRNGVPSSDQATITWYFRRYGDLLTITAIVEDPVYLAQPYILNRTWQLNPNAVISPIPAPCEPTIESPGVGEGQVPHYLPGANPFVNELTERYGIPVEATLGGPETMYPEFWKTIMDKYIRPDRCTRFCCGWEGGGAVATLPNCTLREAPLTRRTAPAAAR